MIIRKIRIHNISVVYNIAFPRTTNHCGRFCIFNLCEELQDQTTYSHRMGNRMRPELFDFNRTNGQTQCPLSVTADSVCKCRNGIRRDIKYAVYYGCSSESIGNVPWFRNGRRLEALQHKGLDKELAINGRFNCGEESERLHTERKRERIIYAG
jgi:hypothetical protein